MLPNACIALKPQLNLEKKFTDPTFLLHTFIRHQFQLPLLLWFNRRSFGSELCFHLWLHVFNSFFQCSKSPFNTIWISIVSHHSYAPHFTSWWSQSTWYFYLVPAEKWYSFIFVKIFLKIHQYSGRQLWFSKIKVFVSEIKVLPPK